MQRPDEETIETIWLWIWRGQLLLVPAVFYLFHDFWELVSVLYLIEVSLYANAKTVDSKREAIRAKRAASSD
jgi:hypothetical protein